MIFGGSRFALGAALQLPSLAATELERKGTFSKEALAEAERFALTEYLTTLAGPRPKGEAARDFYARVAQISGLPEDVVTRSRGFIRDAYVKHLRSAEGKIVSRYDATFAVADPFPEQETARGPDPLLDGLTRAYGGAFAAYARDELGFKTEMTYILLASDVSGKWDWGEHSGRGTASVSDDVRELLALVPSFRLLIAHGYSDMVTPYAVSRYVLDHLPPIGDPSRTQLRLYRGGHMFYIDAELRKALQRGRQGVLSIGAVTTPAFVVDWHQLLSSPRKRGPIFQSRWLWVPAFAGTKSRSTDRPDFAITPETPQYRSRHGDRPGRSGRAHRAPRRCSAARIGPPPAPG